MKYRHFTTPPATLGVIREHIIRSERPIPHLYLDSKGNPTIGVGFKIDSENQFAKLNLKVIKIGKEVPATEAEKRQAYRNIMTVRQNLISGKKNPDDNPFQKRDSDSYKSDTNIRLKAPEMNAMLDREIAARIGNIRAEVGEAAWRKLTRTQQAAAVDIGYNTGDGGLKGFPRLKQAIIAGDAKAMARESLIFTDKANGARNHGRLSRNHAAFSGLPKAESDRGLAALLRTKGEELPDFLRKSLAAVDFLGDDSVADEPDGSARKPLRPSRRHWRTAAPTA